MSTSEQIIYNLWGHFGPFCLWSLSYAWLAPVADCFLISKNILLRWIWTQSLCYFSGSCLWSQQINQNISFPCKGLSRNAPASDVRWRRTGMDKAAIHVPFYGSYGCCFGRVPWGIRTVLKMKIKNLFSTLGSFSWLFTYKETSGAGLLKLFSGGKPKPSKRKQYRIHVWSKSTD